MGRPSLAAQRSAEILDAFERCVAQFGLGGSSLERIAEEAGMKRSILRHYVGNRDDLILALGERVIGKYRKQMASLAELEESDNRKASLLDYLLPKQPIGTTENLLVMEALIGGARKYDDLQTMLTGYIDDLIAQVAKILRCECANAKPTACWSVAYGLISICFNHESLVPLDLPARYRRGARDAAMSLMGTLG